MEIAGLVKTSLIDFPGKITTVIFTQGCNFRCGFCHNPDLVPIKKGKISEGEVLTFLSGRRNKIEGVVITGGEPVIQKDLVSFLEKIKKMGFLIKLDTNGSKVKTLKELIDKKLVDYVAMDVKGPLEKYPEIAKCLNTKSVQESIKLLKKSKIDHEFRTTVLPCLHQMDDFNKIGKLLQGAKLYTIQNFRPDVTLNLEFSSEKSFSPKELAAIAKIMRKNVKKIVIHSNIG
jgi:pyruvate formate lyase activating enzyme